MFESTLSITQIAAIVLFVLGVVAMLIAFWRHRKSKTPKAQLLRGLALFLLVSALYAVDAELGRFANIVEKSGWILSAISFLWWLSLGYLCTRILDTVLWRGILTVDGQLLVPKILVYMSYFFIFLIVTIFFTRVALGKDISILLTGSAVFVAATAYLIKAPFESAFAGLALNLTPMFKKGEFVDIGGNKGFVVDVGWSQVVLLTPEGSNLYIPNTQVTKEIITNFDRPSSVRVNRIEITLNYSVTIAKGRAVIMEALADLGQHFTRYQVFVKDFSASGVVYVILYWRNEKFAHTHALEETNDILATLYYRILKSPQVKLAADKDGLIHRALEKETAMSPEDIKTLLRKVDIFESIDDTQLARLAELCLIRPFGPPEIVIHQGDRGDSMFIVGQGKVAIYLKRENGEIIDIAVDGPGEYFGEMALLTGQPRGANVRALEDAVLLEIPKTAMAALFEEAQELVSEIADSVAKRQAENEALKAAADQRAINIGDRSKSLADALRNSVLSFFGLREKAKS